MSTFGFEGEPSSRPSRIIALLVVVAAFVGIGLGMWIFSGLT